jgi:hypothetical protein
MKHLFNDISKQEKQRILEMHKSATRKNYLFEQTQPTPPTPVPPNQQGQSQPTPPTPDPCDANITLKAKVFKDPQATDFHTNIEILERKIYGDSVEFRFNMAGSFGGELGRINCGSNQIYMGEEYPTYLGPVTTKKATCLCDEYMAKNKGATSNQA